MWQAAKSFLLPIWVKSGYYIMLALGVVGVFMGIRQGGKDAARKEQAEDNLEAVEKAHEVENRIDSLDADKRMRLRKKWTR